MKHYLEQEAEQSVFSLTFIFQFVLSVLKFTFPTLFQG